VLAVGRGRCVIVAADGVFEGRGALTAYMPAPPPPQLDELDADVGAAEVEGEVYTPFVSRGQPEMRGQHFEGTGPAGQPGGHGGAEGGGDGGLLGGSEGELSL
jgi:hypothetical protein